MALYLKQDFTPPILSRRWIAMKFRPNMILNSRHNIICILESGLLFREDSIEVEQEAPLAEAVWRAAGGVDGGWLTRGERVVVLGAIACCIVAFPPRSFQRSTLIHLAVYLTMPLAIRACHRLACRGSLPALLAIMRDYLALARRTAACLRECAALRAELGSVSSAIESTHTMLCRQQSELAIVMSRASSALLGNAPWLRGDVAWDAVARDGRDADNLMKIHHAFLVVQSTLLKHIAMAHYIPSINAQKMYKNYNERVYWIHSVLLTHLAEDFKQNFEALERMYRLLKNYGNSDVNATKKPGTAMYDRWTYSDVHSGIAKASLELKLALNKSNNLDMFLDSCALNQQELDIDILNKDLDNLIDCITKCLTSAQNSQIRLKKLQNKFGKTENKLEYEELIEDDRDILRIDDREPETKDEVFYFVRTDDDDNIVQPIGDISTGPGKKEKEVTKIVLGELRRKLVRREDVMRERERQALVKTMPEYKDNIPEFPRQINDDVADRKGYITKIQKKRRNKRVLIHYKIRPRQNKRKYKLGIDKYCDETEIKNTVYEANTSFSNKTKLLTFCKQNNDVLITKWIKRVAATQRDLDSSGLSEGLSDVEAGTVNRSVNQAVNANHNENNGEARNYKFSKKDLELSPSSSESDSDAEYYRDKQMKLLNDVRKYRAMRKKNHPDKRGSIPPDDGPVDESLRPVEYRFGTGMAMASVLQTNNSARVPHMASEEVFVGDGEVSEDSGNDEDA